MEPIEIHVRLSPDDEVLALRARVAKGGLPAMELHDRLKAAREDADLTQAQVAEQTGIARRQYIRYEQGAQEMGIAKLRALCLALGVSADYLLGLPRGLSWPR